MVIILILVSSHIPSLSSNVQHLHQYIHQHEYHHHQIVLNNTNKVRDLDPTNQLTFVRIASKKHEVFDKYQHNIFRQHNHNSKKHKVFDKHQHYHQHQHFRQHNLFCRHCPHRQYFSSVLTIFFVVIISSIVVTRF